MDGSPFAAQRKGFYLALPQYRPPMAGKAIPYKSAAWNETQAAAVAWMLRESIRLLCALFGLLCSLIGGTGLRIETARGVSMQKFARDIGPEFLKDGAEAALCGDDKAIGEGLADPGILGRVIEIGDRTRDDVA
jgi:hypothetical protein